MVPWHLSAAAVADNYENLLDLASFGVCCSLCPIRNNPLKKKKKKEEQILLKLAKMNIVVNDKGRHQLKKNVFFWALPECMGGGLPMPEFFGPFFHHVFPYILTSISCYLILFGHF